MAFEIPLKYLALALIILATILEVAGDILFKKWSLNGRTVVLIVGFVIYFIGTIFWAFSLKYEFMSSAISILSILNLIAVVIIGTIYFGENLSLINKIGIILGIISVVLIEL